MGGAISQRLCGALVVGLAAAASADFAEAFSQSVKVVGAVGVPDS